MNEIILVDQTQTENKAFLVDPKWKLERDAAERGYVKHKDSIHRVGAFLQWLAANRLSWANPDLGKYRDYLSNDATRPLAARSVQAHLSTLRSRYKTILGDSNTRDYFYSMTPDDSPLADRKAAVDEMTTRIENAIKPDKSKVKMTTVQDVADSDHRRLTPAQINSLIQSPGLDTLKAIRDTAILALTACTGIREAELAALEVADLRQKLGGELALQIRHGKGDKQRMVPYGNDSWCLVFVDKWLASAGITGGFVFRGMKKGGKIRPDGITTRSLIAMVTQYPVCIDGKQVKIKMHDLRRSYAKNQFLDGMPMEIIRQNLGHADVKTTQTYIGILDAKYRASKGIYQAPAELLKAARGEAHQPGLPM